MERVLNDRSSVAAGAVRTLSRSCRRPRRCRRGGTARIIVGSRVADPWRRSDSAMHLSFAGTVRDGDGHRPGEVWRGGVNAPWLTVLALSRGRVVADTTLIEQLWSDGEQPVDPVNALQTRVSKLRRALAGAGGGATLDPAGRRVPPGRRPRLRRRSPLRLVDRAGSPGRGRGRRRSACMTRRWRSGGQSRSWTSPAIRGRRWRSPGWSSCGSPPIAERAERMLTLGRYRGSGRGPGAGRRAVRRPGSGWSGS